MTRPTRDETMMELARVIAKRSTCVRRAVGAVAVDAHGRVLAMGHNGVPMGQPHCVDVPCPGAGLPHAAGLDRCQAVHAEQNLVMFCPDVTKIDTIYLTDSPCLHCVKILLNTSARQIVHGGVYDHAALDRWLAAGRAIAELRG